MNAWATAATVVGLPLALTTTLACATTSVRTDYDRGAEFDRYRTYLIRSGPLVRERDVVVEEPDRVVRDHIHDALSGELTARGLTPVSHEMPDIVVTYAVTARRERELVETIGGSPDWNYGGYNIFPRDVDRGTLVIDVIEVRTDKLVWRSIARAEDEEVRSAGFIDKAVEKAMNGFPPDVTS